MRNSLKYFCAILLLIGTSARALAADATYYVWDSSTSQWAPYVVQDENLTVVEGPDAPNGKTFIGWHIWNPDEYPYWKVSDYSGYILTNGSAYYSSGSEYATVYVRYCPGTAGNTAQKNIGTNEADNKFYAIYSSGDTNWEKNAGWNAGSTDQVTITFNKNGGSGTNYTQKVLKNTPTQLHVCEYNPPASNQRFIGWATTYAHATAGTVDYNDMASITATGDITLWAVWKTFVTITYNLTGLDHNGANPTKLDVGRSTFSADFSFDSGFEGPVSGTVAVGDFYTYTLGSDAEVSFSAMTLTWTDFKVAAGDNIVVTLSATEISCTKLSTPTSLTANPYFDDSGTDKVKCSWSCASDITSHASYLKFSYGLEGQSAINTWSNLLTSYTNWKKPRSELSAGQYWWKVQALGDGTDYCDGDVATGSFCVDDVATSTPSGVTISSITSSSASISWSAMSNATDYAVTIKNNSTNVIVDGYDEYMVESGTSLNVTGLSSGVTYKFEIYAMNACSDFSETYTTTFTTSDIYLITLDKNTFDPGSEDGLAFVDENGTSMYDTDIPTRTHYHVAGYYTDAECTEANKIATDEGALQPSISVSSTPWTNSSSQWIKGGDATFYTKWEGNACEITLNNQSATTPGTRKVTATYGSNTNLNRIGTNPTKAGYKFQGYFTSTGGGGVQLIDENGYWLANKTGYTDASRNWEYEESTLEIYAYWALQEYGNALAWCPEPELILDGTTYITSLYHTDNGGMIRGAQQLTLTGVNMASGASVTLTSNNANVYFSTEATHNIHRTADSKKPKTSLTFTTDINGKLNGDAGYTIYVHFMPSEVGDGSINDVTVTATYAVPDPDIVSTTHVYTRSMPAQFVIAAKVGDIWYALPADMTTPSNPKPIQIDVNETNWTAKGSANLSYAMWPVRTVDSDGAEYTTKGSWLRFAGQGGYGLWANNSSSAYTIKIDNSSNPMDNTHVTGDAYMWEAVTTPTNALSPSSGTFSYTLQMHNSSNTNYLNIKTSDNIWGTYSSGYQLTNEMYLLPLTVVEKADITVMEWGTNEVAVKCAANTTLTSVKIDGTEISPISLTQICGDIYKITGAGMPDLTTMETYAMKTMVIDVQENSTAKQCVLSIPFILDETATAVSLRNLAAGSSQDAKNHCISNFDVVVRNGGRLNVTNDESTYCTFRDLYIYPGGKVHVNTLDLGANNVYLRGGFSWLDATKDYRLPQMFVENGKSISGVGSAGRGIFYDLYLDNSMYYMMALPKDVLLDDITTETGSKTFDAWVKGYSGEGRTLSPKESGWSYAWANGGTTLYRGKGYEIAIKPTSSRTIGILRFPLLSATAWTDEAACTPSVTAWGVDKPNDVTANNQGWNFIGAPYFSSFQNRDENGRLGTNMEIRDMQQHKPDGVHWDGTWDWVTTSAVKYVTIPNKQDEDYTDVRAKNYTLEAFYPFFIQAKTPGTLSFENGSRVIKTHASTLATVPAREVDIDFLITDPNGETDNAGLTVGNDYSAEFDLDDKEKTIVNENFLKVYTIVGEYRTAFNALPEAAAALPIPVGYIAPTDGKYVISLDENEYRDVEHIWLTDYETNTTVDLIDANDNAYEFETTKGANDTRFALNIILKPEQDPIVTGTETIDGENELPTKFIYQDKMYIRYRGVIYDATGKKVSEINK